MKNTTKRSQNQHYSFFESRLNFYNIEEEDDNFPDAKNMSVVPDSEEDGDDREFYEEDIDYSKNNPAELEDNEEVYWLLKSKS